MQFAFQFGSRTKHEIYKSEIEDVNFRLEVEDKVYVGNSFDAAVVVENKSEVTREIKVNFTAVLSFYTGVPAKKLKGYKLKFRLNSQAGNANIYLPCVVIRVCTVVPFSSQRPRFFWSASRIETSGRSRFFEHEQSTHFAF